MKLKADAVLNAVVQGAPATLPALGSYNFSGLGGTPPPAGHARPQQQQRSRLQLPARTRSAPSEQAATRRQQQQLAAALFNPSSDASRTYLASRFGVAAPAARVGARPVGKPPAGGKLAHGKRSGPLGVVAGEHRRDPGAEPPIHPRDVAAGLLSLTQRGLLPPHVDLTPALAREPAPVTQVSS